MSTMGTEICGSSSRGMVSNAIRPTARAVSRKSGVSGERIVLRVMEPEMSSFICPYSGLSMRSPGRSPLSTS